MKYELITRQSGSGSIASFHSETGREVRWQPSERFTYRIVLKKEEPEGGHTVSVPTLPGCITYGENREDAFTMVKEAIMAYARFFTDTDRTDEIELSV